MNEKLIQLAKRRGLLWPSFEIYGGVSGFIDFGPLGTKILRKIENLWRQIFMYPHDFIYEISTPIVMPEIVFDASGHLKHFTDIVLTCSSCKNKYRVDHIIEIDGIETWSLEEIEKYIKENNIRCIECKGEFEKPSHFNLLMKTNIGPLSTDVGYLRPEAAQGIFINFKRMYEIARRKLPFGIVQIGKVQRNEIAPRKGLYRMREFTIIDFEMFYDPQEPNCNLIEKVYSKKIRLLDAEARYKNLGIREMTIEEALKNKIILSEWLAYFMCLSQEFLQRLGIPYEKQYFLEKLPGERAHYSSQTFDHMVIANDEKVEIAGFALRADYDTKNHSIKSGVELKAERIKDGKVVEKFYPHVAEPSFGLERLLLCSLSIAYTEKDGRIILKLPSEIAPYQAAVLPLVSKDNIPETAYKIYEYLKENGIDCIYDDTEYIGKAYAKYDEIGVPYCITVDYQTLSDNSVTIRNRDDWRQIRVEVKNLVNVLNKLLRREIKFEEAGILVKK
jgi:glycyl-tRNA synthetase